MVDACVTHSGPFRDVSHPAGIAWGGYEMFRTPSPLRKKVLDQADPTMYRCRLVDNELINNWNALIGLSAYTTAHVLGFVIEIRSDSR